MYAPETPWVLVILAALCFPFLPNLIYAVGGSVGMLFSDARRRELLCRTRFKQSVDLAYILALPAFTLLLVLSGASRHGFWYTLAVMAGWAVARELAVVLLSRRGVNTTLADTARLFRSCFLLATLLCIPAGLMIWLVPASVPGITAPAVAAAAGILLLTYVFNSYKLFLSPKFSHFISFLYLCGLDLLPIAVVVQFLVQ